MFRDKVKRMTGFLLAGFFAFMMICPLVSVSAASSDDSEDLFVQSYNSEYDNFCLIYDEADILSDSQEKQLIDAMYPISDYSHVILTTISVNGYGYSETSNRYEKEYASAVYDSFIKMNRLNNKDCIIFIIDMDTRWLYLYREGSSEFKNTLSEGKCDSITDNVYSYASNSDYYNCSKKVFEQVLDIMEGKRIAQPMKVACNLLIGMSISFLVTYLIASSKSKVHSPSNEEALKYAVSSFRHSEITDVLTNVTKTYCPRSSGSSGGGRSHGGGGHSHGGGGGHRF